MQASIDTDQSCKYARSYYLFFIHRRRTVQERAVLKWPGNDIPIFRKNQTALIELNALVDELPDQCSYAPAGFGKVGIRQHILDTLNERRRRVHKGHNFDKVFAECQLYFLNTTSIELHVTSMKFSLYPTKNSMFYKFNLIIIILSPQGDGRAKNVKSQASEAEKDSHKNSADHMKVHDNTKVS